jgi:tetratricopeptide (TPR) repeat protein
MRPFLRFLPWVALAVLAGSAWASPLGSIHFPTTGSAEAQKHFLRGVAAMHSFWYEEALEEFRAATELEPEFAMGYWGEAMAYNHPIWREQDRQAGRAALQKVKATEKLTPRERAYLDAVRVLYGEGEKSARDERYADAMAKIYQLYPEDLEAACFYALALLGTVHQVEAGYHRRIQAGALALEIFQKNPDHPCAAHYAIHAFDHPDLAILALPAARRYAQIAPEAHHAQHMPAHIFLQLGMWPETAASNKSGWTDSLAWVSRKNLPLYHRDYHSLHWLHYAYLQLGQQRRAAEVLAEKQADMRLAAAEKSSKPPPSGWEVSRFYPEMMAEWMIETEKWDTAPSVWEVPGASSEDSAKAVAFFMRGYSAAMQGRAEEGQTHLAALRAVRKPDPDPADRRAGKVQEIWVVALGAALDASKGDHVRAIESMKQAVRIEEALPAPSGPPAVLKPSHELLGEILLRAGRPKEAAQQFAVSLQRHPRRARSLLGAARAAVQMNDHDAAAERYAALREIYRDADGDVAEVQEARSFK